jgi:hypothetical protein
MAEDDKNGPAPDDGSPETKLQRMLESRWDPGRMSRFMRSSETSRSRGLDFSQRSRFEGRLGVDLSNVKIFSGELAEEITTAHGAEALTVGDTGMILMKNSASFAPGSAAATALLAHELTHVAQSKPSAVSFKKTSRTLAEENESEAEAEEHEADVMEEETGTKEKTQADKDAGKRNSSEKIFEAVLKLMEEETFMQGLRLGGRSGTR